jgi:ATP-dependent DNA helicase DinG
VSALDRIFASALATVVPGYSARAQQVEMARAVAETLDAREVLVCEAGTGTGKTLAYLVPLLASGLRAVVSTGTRHLQDQLHERELPRAVRAVGRPVDAVRLKGRANYLCRFRLARSLDEGVSAGRFAVDLQVVAQWAGRTRTGDVAELHAVAEDSGVWPAVTSTADNCLGQECPEFDRCHVVTARRAAMEADLVVVNHHLFLADLTLKEEGFAELLPSAEAVVLDEAHRLPDLATRFFGTRLSTAQLGDLARDCLSAFRADAADDAELPRAVAVLEGAAAGLARRLGPAGARVEWASIVGRSPDVSVAATALGQALDGLVERLAVHEERTVSLAACSRRARALAERLAVVGDDADASRVRWIEVAKGGFSWHSSPLEVDALLGPRITDGTRAWVLTSATLAVRGSLEHFVRRLGVEGARTAVWESPFDYAGRSLLYLPAHMPDRRAQDYPEAFDALVVDVVEASAGRAFILFTSHAALARCARTLAGRVHATVLVQGEAPRGALLARFVHEQPAVLLGTASFWEGVDVRGEALSCVVIDRLPFASPGEPLVQARIRALRQSGRAPFTEMQVPEAVIALKQGVGRLIRDERDRGVVVIADPRIAGRGYGRVFLDSLPPMRRTREAGAVAGFFAEPAAVT